MQSKSNKKLWWEEDYGFFGDFYMQGDDSVEGYLENKKMTLKERTDEEVQGIIRLCSLKKGDKVLDCPCGYGRHSIGLAEKDFSVVGVDINSTELNIAKKRAKSERANIKFVKKNMLNLKYHNEFDAVINMFYSFGFFDSDKDNLKALKNFYNSVKKGGIFLMHTDVNMPRVVAGKFREYEKRPLKNGGCLRIVEFFNQETKRNHGIWIIEKGNKVKMKDYSVRVYTDVEFINLCKQVGFSDVKVYSNWNGEEYTSDSEDMIVVAKK